MGGEIGVHLWHLILSFATFLAVMLVAIVVYRIAERICK